MPVEIVLIALEERRGMARFPGLLRRAGGYVTLLGNTRIAMGWSRFVNRKIPCGSKPAEIALAARALIHQCSSPPWLMCCDDRALAALAPSRGEPWMERMYPVDDGGPLAEALYSRSGFADAAREAIAMAPSVACDTPAKAAGAAQRLGFPVILRRDIDRARKNSISINAEDDLAAAWETMSDPGPVLVQKMIEGQSGATDILFHRGRPVCWSSMYADRATRACDKRLDELIATVGSFTGFQGFAGVDWTQDPAGDFYLTRFTPGPTPGLSRGNRNGVDFSRALWELFHGMLRVQKPRAGRQPSLRDRLAPLTGIPWTDPGLLVRGMLDFARGR